jgi:hypothetical protein
MPPTQLKRLLGFGLRAQVDSQKNVGKNGSFNKGYNVMLPIGLTVLHFARKVSPVTHRYQQRQNGHGNAKQRLKVGELTVSFSRLKLKKLVMLLLQVGVLIVSFNPLRRNERGSSKRVRRD